VHEIPLVTQPTLFIHGGGLITMPPGRAKCAGGAAAEDWARTRRSPQAAGGRAIAGWRTPR